MDTAKTLQNYIAECAAKVQTTDFEKLASIAERIVETKKTGARIFTAGNGGSSSTASHIVNDLVKGCRMGDVLGKAATAGHAQVGFNVMCLNDSSCLVTCMGNDFSYDEVFEIQLSTFAKAGDMLIVYSGSGNSPNIVNACRYAKDNGIFVIGFGGRDGGKMAPLCDICLIAPTDSMEMLEDMHLMYEHALVVAIRELL